MVDGWMLRKEGIRRCCSWSGLNQIYAFTAHADRHQFIYFVVFESRLLTTRDRLVNAAQQTGPERTRTPVLYRRPAMAPHQVLNTATSIG